MPAWPASARASAPRKRLRDQPSLAQVRVRKDAAAAALVALALLVFLATQQHWNVWLIGDSRRWAAGAIFVLGAFACGKGSPEAFTQMDKDPASGALGVLGVVTLAFAVAAIVTGSMVALAALVIGIVVMWAGATTCHAIRGARAPHQARPRY